MNVTGMTLSNSGEKWLVGPAGLTPAGTTTPLQEVNNIRINGVIAHDPSRIISEPGENFAAGNNFSITVPASAMVLLRIPVT